MNSIQSINPFNLEILEEYEELSPQGIDKSIQKAEQAFYKWKQTTMKKKCRKP